MSASPFACGFGCRQWFRCLFVVLVLGANGISAFMDPCLVPVHRGVCAAEERIDAAYGSVVDVEPDGNVDSGGAHDGFDFGKIFSGLLLVHVFADHEEFITAHAEGVVAVRVVDQNLGGTLNQYVAGVVAIGVVCLFEIVDVSGEQGEITGSVISRHIFVKASSVECSGERVAPALLLDFRHVVAASDHRGQKAREGGQNQTCGPEGLVGGVDHHCEADRLLRDGQLARYDVPDMGDRKAEVRMFPLER